MNENDSVSSATAQRKLVRPGVAAILGVWSFAVAQPLYELFSRQPTFILAHDLTGWSLLAFVGVVSLVAPLLLGIGITLLRPRQLTFGCIVEWLVLFALLWLFSSYLVGTLLDSDNAFVQPGASLLGALLLLSLSFFVPQFLELLRFSAFSSALFAAWFLWALPSGYLMGKPSSVALDPPLVIPGENIPDIVLLVFDELSLGALLDDNLEIRADLFPNFARLAAESDWYTQVSTVAARTRLAVPGLLTGKMASPASSPDFAHHPINLFSMLEPFYDLNVFEPVSKLCEFDACRGKVVWRRTAEDTAVVYAHLVVPKPFRHRLPQLTGQWAGFLNRSGETIHDERLRNFNTFVEQMALTESPGLHFFHSLLPHIPYSTLPTGHRLFRHGATAGHVTSDQRDEIASQPWADVEARYFYRWQLQLVDRMIGDMTDRLRGLGTYDHTLFIVTADHGVRIKKGFSRRQPYANDYIDIASIPLFVKRPGQRMAQRIERPFETIDLLPLVLQTVGIDTAPYKLGRRFEGGKRMGRRLRSHMEFLNLPELLPTSDYQRCWPPEEDAPAIDLPAKLRRCASSVSLLHPELYQQTHPQHFLAAHMVVEEVDDEQSEVLVQFNNALYRAQRSGSDRWSAFLSAGAFESGYNSVRILGKEDDSWCELYSNLK